MEELCTSGELFFGGAVNPRDSDLSFREDGDELVFSKRMTFSTGGLVSDLKMFALTGARATANTVGLDIHWRNLRRHGLHDPLPYEQREVGSFVVLDEIPEPSWYT